MANFDWKNGTLHEAKVGSILTAGNVVVIPTIDSGTWNGEVVSVRETGPLAPEDEVFVTIRHERGQVNEVRTSRNYTGYLLVPPDEDGKDEPMTWEEQIKRDEARFGFPDTYASEYDRLHQVGMEASVETERRQAEVQALVIGGGTPLREDSGYKPAEEWTDEEIVAKFGPDALAEEPTEAETMAKVTGSVGATFTKQRVDTEGNIVEESRESYGQTEPPAPHEDEWVDALLAPEPLDTWVVTVAPRGGLKWTTLEVWAHNRTEAINLGIEKGFGEFATRTTRTISGSSQTQVIVKVFGVEVAQIDAGLKRKD